VDDDATTYEQLARYDGYQNLDEKIYLSIDKMLKQNHPAPRRPLIDMILNKLDDHWVSGKRKPTGRQLIFLVRKHYSVRDVQMDTCCFKALANMTYWKDDKLPQWKNHWDYLLRRQKVRPTDNYLEELFVVMCRQSAQKLVKHVEMYDRSSDGDHERSYQYMERMVNKVIADDLTRMNANNLTANTLSGVTEPKKQPGAPGVTGGSTGDPPATTPKKDTKGGGKDPKKGKDHDKGKGKGDKGKGKGKDGGKSQHPPKPDDANKKPLDPNRSCITHFFGKCKHGAVPAPGTKCDHGCHRKAPTDADRQHYLFKRMENQHGTWEPGKFPYPPKPNAAPAPANAAATGGPAQGGPTKTTPAGSPRTGAKS